jgi:putative flippase GtrA
MPSERALIRFLEYATIGTSTSALDFYFLWVLTSQFGVHYLISSGVMFLIAATLDYLADRHFVFSNSKRDAEMGYLYFLAILGAGLVMTLLAMAVMVEIFNMNYIVSRILVAGAVGMWSYLMNLYVNFKVAGKY